MGGAIVEIEKILYKGQGGRKHALIPREADACCLGGVYPRVNPGGCHAYLVFSRHQFLRESRVCPSF